MITTETNITFLSRNKPRITGNDIPEDVWRLIVEQVALLTDSVLPFMGLNRAFFEYALAQRYREVQWVVLTDAFSKKLERLQEPIIAQHVRVLHIRAWFIRYLLQRDALFHPSSIPAKSKAALLAPFAFAWSKIYGDSQSKPMPQWMLQRQHQQTNKGTSCTTVIQSMIKAVEGMRNVVQLNFEWRDLPVNPETRRFLTSTRTSLDRSLRKLTLRAQLTNFKELLAFANFDNLDELNFHFDYKVQGIPDAKLNKRITVSEEDQPDPEVQESLKTIIPFIERRQTSLQSLSISSTSSMDLSPFLKALPSNIPSLRRFALQIFYDQCSLSNPSAFLHILVSRSFSLRHVSLMANLEQSSLAVKKQISNLYPAETNLSMRRRQWNPVNQVLLSHPRCLSNLETLEIPFVSLSKTLPLLRRSCDTLTRLRLVDHYLNRNEVKEILGLFSHRPLEVEHLHIEVIVLDFDLIDLLATHLPDLSSLVLIYRDTVQFTTFEVHTPVPSLLNWKLHECEAFKEHFNPLYYYLDSGSGTAEQGTLMLTLLRLIPSLHTFNRIRRRK